VCPPSQVAPAILSILLDLARSKPNKDILEGYLRTKLSPTITHVSGGIADYSLDDIPYKLLYLTGTRGDARWEFFDC
jgi:hypothetical protein